MKEKQLKVICYDLNSIYISFHETAKEQSNNLIEEISNLVNEFWNNHFSSELNRKNFLNFSKKMTYQNFFLYQQSMSYKQKEKINYQAFVENGNTHQYIDSLKRKKNEPRIVSIFCQFLLENIFNDISPEQLEQKIINWKKELKDSKYDNQLILTKKIIRNKEVDEEYQDLIEQYKSHHNHFPDSVFFVLVKNNKGLKYQLSEKNKILFHENELDYDSYLNKFILVAAKKILLNSRYEKCLQYLDPKNKGQISLF